MLDQLSRRVGSAQELSKIGTSALPQFEVDVTGAMYNNCWVVITSSLIDEQYISKTLTHNESQDVGNPPVVTAWHEHPVIRTMDLAETGFAKFRYGGTISVTHRTKDVSRGFSSASTSLNNNNLAKLEQRLLQLECSDSKLKKIKKNIDKLLNDDIEDEALA